MESSAIVLISGVPAFDAFGLFRGDIPLIGLFLGERPTIGVPPLGLLVTPGLGCFVDESRRFWFLKEVLKLSCRSSVVAMILLKGLTRPSTGRVRRVGFFNFRSGRVRVLKKYFGSGWVSGICIKYQVNWVLLGIEILTGYSPSISFISYTF